MTKIVNVHEAKTHLSRLLDLVQQGEDVIVAKSGRPVAKLVPVGAGTARRVPGSAKGKLVIADDFDAPLPEPLLTEFES